MWLVQMEAALGVMPLPQMLSQEQAAYSSHAALQHVYAVHGSLLRAKADATLAARAVCSDVLWLLYAWSWSEGMLQAACDLSNTNVDVPPELWTHLISQLLMVAELLPVRLAQWVGAVTGQPSAAAERLTTSLEAVASAEGVPQLWESKGCVRERLSSQQPANSASYVKLAEQLQGQATGSREAFQQFVQSPAFKALWGWGGEAAGGLCRELHAAGEVEVEGMDRWEHTGGQLLPPGFPACHLPAVVEAVRGLID